MGTTYRLSCLYRLFNGRFRPKTAAVILAGGLGTRMKNADGLTKQMLLLEGIPVVVRSVQAFDRCPYIDEIIVVARKEECDTVRTMMAEYKIKKLSRVVCGGETRQLSARKGLAAISDRAKYIAIHDAARCLITPDMIADVVAAAYANRAASAGTAVTDTVKQLTQEGYIQKTLDRRTIYLAQTPQVFDANLYRAAVYTAKQEDAAATDDNLLVEGLGQAIRMVDCGKENLKITTDIDLIFAKAILDARKEKGHA